MTDKTIRILLADHCQDQLLTIEKALNRLAYYRIAPVRTFGDLTLLTSEPSNAFGLLIVNKALAVPSGMDLQAFCRARPHILNTLFYENPSKNVDVQMEWTDSTVSVSIAESPNSNTLSALMNVIDPPTQWEKLRSLPWLH